MGAGSDGLLGGSGSSGARVGQAGGGHTRAEGRHMWRYGSLVGLSTYTLGFFLAFLIIVFGGASAWSGTRKGDPMVGRRLFMTHCYTCHGVTGRGDGPAAARLEPKPRNLTDDAYMSTRKDQDLFTAISSGS